MDLFDLEMDNWMLLVPWGHLNHLIFTQEKDDVTLFVVFVFVCFMSWIWGFVCVYCSGEIWKKWTSSELHQQRSVDMSDASDLDGADLQGLMEDHVER